MRDVSGDLYASSLASDGDEAEDCIVGHAACAVDRSVVRSLTVDEVLRSKLGLWERGVA